MSVTETIPTADVIRSKVDAYLDALHSGSSATIAALYSDDAILEDPVGSESKVGREAIVRTTAHSRAPGRRPNC